MNSTDYWERRYGVLICPICDSRFGVDDQLERYRHCPFCGERLYLPEEEET